MINDITQKMEKINCVKFPDNQHAFGGFSKEDAENSLGV